MRTFLFAAGLCLMSGTSLATAEEIHCRVVGVSDGDTFTCLTISKRQVKVRLSEVDAPESKQPYGSRARQALGSVRKVLPQASQRASQRDHCGKTPGELVVTGANSPVLF